MYRYTVAVPQFDRLKIRPTDEDLFQKTEALLPKDSRTNGGI